MATNRQWKQTLEAVRQVVESLRPDPIERVDAQMMADMAAYSKSAQLARRRRAECLCSAIVFKLIGMEVGRDHSRSIKHHLARGLEWRQREKAITNTAHPVRIAA
jgi:hypothetical protein